MSDEIEEAEARIGRSLDGKWTLESLLGVGGMGVVYAARHRNGARGAVKLLHAELAADTTVRDRFLREGYAANRVEHPGAVRVLDDDTVRSGPDAGAAYLVMEMLEGRTLQSHARASGGTVSEAELLAVAEGVLEVLAAAHARGIVHRDLKPDNLFLVTVTHGAPPPTVWSGEGSLAWRGVKILDFGVARIESSTRTRVGTALGTPAYMPPEQARGEVVDGRADIYALGATLLRALTGKRVHELSSIGDLLALIATTPAPPVRTMAPQVREPLAAVIDRAMAFRREDRYPDAAAMLADVRALRAGAPVVNALPPLAPPSREPPTRTGAQAAPVREPSLDLAIAPLGSELAPTATMTGRASPAAASIALASTPVAVPPAPSPTAVAIPPGPVLSPTAVAIAPAGVVESPVARTLTDDPRRAAFAPAAGAWNAPSSSVDPRGPTAPLVAAGPVPPWRKPIVQLVAACGLAFIVFVSGAVCVATRLLRSTPTDAERGARADEPDDPSSGPDDPHPQPASDDEPKEPSDVPSPKAKATPTAKSPSPTVKPAAPPVLPPPVPKSESGKPLSEKEKEKAEKEKEKAEKKKGKKD